MSQQPIPIQTALPQSTVLSYVASLESPTRVRLVASRTLRITGWILLVISVVALAFSILDFHAFARTSLMSFPSIGSSGTTLYTPYSTFGSPHVSTTEMLADHFLRNPIPIMALAFSFLTGILLVTAAGPIRRGRKVGCLIAIPPLVLHLFLFFFFAVLGSCTILLTFMSMDSFGMVIHLIWIIPLTALMILLTLIAKDLIAILIWISRNPLTEKPPVPFI